MGYLSCKTEVSVITCNVRRDEIEPPKLRTFRYKELEAATKGFSRDQLIGKGSYGWVYKGRLRDGTRVAVKRSSSARKSAHQGDDSPLENELEVLSKIRSPRLVNLIGFSRDNKETLLVVDFMANGTLYDVLHSPRSEPLGWSHRLQVALQVAKGLRALHTATPPVIHRDVKSSNVLIDADWNAKLGDFGLALRGRIEDVIRLSTPPAGTMGYLDPGYVSPGHLSTKTDVFSFGILLLEIMSGRNAIDVQYYPPNIVDWALPLIKQGRAAAICDPKARHPANVEAFTALAAVAARCVRLSSSRRPSMVEVVKELREISKRLQMPLLWNTIAKPLKPVLLEDGSKEEQQQDDETDELSTLMHGGSASRGALFLPAAASPSRELIPAISSSIVSVAGTSRRARVRMIYAEDKLPVASQYRRTVKMGEYLV